MPRRTPASLAPHQLSPLPSKSSVVPDLELLRRQWKWATFSQFFYMFRPLFSSSEITLVDIEDDLTRTTNIVLPKVMQRLLYALTLDRKVSLENWQSVLRKQYLKRAPERNPFVPDSKSASLGAASAAAQTTDTKSAIARGQSRSDNTSFLSSETSDTVIVGQDLEDGNHVLNGTNEIVYKNWCELPMLVKLDSMHLLTEWQFQNPLRLRSIMKDDDECASWRVEPIGRDAQNNLYWLFGGDRLWIQKPLPETRDADAKRCKDDRVGRNSHKPVKKSISAGHPWLKRGEALAAGSGSLPTSSGASRGARLAKTRANMRLGSTRNERQSRKPTAHEKPLSQRPMGTRVSARLRTDIAKEGWQSVPQEWLTGENTALTSKRPPETAGSAADVAEIRHFDLDSSSDLTELSSDDQKTGCLGSGSETTSAPSLNTDSHPIAQDSTQGFANSTPDVVEWETICITHYDWEQIIKRFESATHPSEKKLYKVLVNDVVPPVVEGLKEIERKQRLEEALIYRKRSSRIALKESEKEKLRETAKRQAEYEERITRARQLQARLHRAEAARDSRILTREQRRREREDEELVYGEGHVDLTSDVPLDTPETPEAGGPNHKDNLALDPNRGGSNGVSRNISPDIWELDCEVCNKRGVNQDDGTPMMSCGMCSKWQHILCHDKADSLVGRPKRNWQQEDFVCQRCRLETSSQNPKISSNQEPNQINTSSHAPLRYAIRLHVPHVPIPRVIEHSLYSDNLTSSKPNGHEQRPQLSNYGSLERNGSFLQPYPGNHHHAITP